MKQRLKFISEKYGAVCAIIVKEFAAAFPDRIVFDAYVDPRHDKIIKRNQVPEEIYWLNVMNLVQAGILVVTRHKKKDVYFLNIAKIEQEYLEKSGKMQDGEVDGKTSLAEG